MIILNIYIIIYTIKTICAIWVIENGSKWNRPILLMVGTEDHIVSQDKIHQFVENVPNEYLTFKEFTGLYHEIHNEYENQQVFNFILDWIHSQN